MQPCITGADTAMQLLVGGEGGEGEEECYVT